MNELVLLLLHESWFLSNGVFVKSTGGLLVERVVVHVVRVNMFVIWCNCFFTIIAFSYIRLETNGNARLTYILVLMVKITRLWFSLDLSGFLDDSKDRCSWLATPARLHWNTNKQLQIFFNLLNKKRQKIAKRRFVQPLSIQPLGFWICLGLNLRYFYY